MKTIETDKAPEAIGTYSQAVKHGSFVFLSGQIPLDPKSMKLVDGDFEQQIRRVFNNLSEVCQAAGGSLADILKLNIYLIDLNNFSIVNEVMESIFDKPYPARAAIQVSALPKGAMVEIDGFMAI